LGLGSLLFQTKKKLTLIILYNNIKLNLRNSYKLREPFKIHISKISLLFLSWMSRKGYICQGEKQTIFVSHLVEKIKLGVAKRAQPAGPTRLPRHFLWAEPKF
jgi:hypothetical protein